MLGAQQPFILGGTYAPGFTAVGIIAIRSESGELGTHCTATVIASRIVLTAAHCVADDYQQYVDKGKMTFVIGSSIDDPQREVFSVRRSDFPNDISPGGFRYRKIINGPSVITLPA